MIAVASGCAGRAEFFRGQELLGAGREREAYQQFWEAYACDPSERHREALQATGRWIAGVERARGRRREVAGDLQGALGCYVLGLEYDQGWPALADDYARVYRWLAEWADLEGQLDAARAVASGPGREVAGHRAGGSWRELEILMAMARHPARVAGRLTDPGDALEKAAARAVAALAGPLRDASFAPPLSEDPAALAALSGRWLGLAEDCRAYLWRLDGELLLDPAAGSDARPETGLPAGGPEGVLRGAVAEAEAAVAVLDRARSGVELHAAAAAREEAGDLRGAIGLYARAAALHPGHDSARGGRARAHELLAAETYQGALAAFGRRDLDETIARLEELLALAPGYRDADRLLGEAKAERAAEHVREAGRCEVAGLPGNALLRLQLASRLERGGARLAAAIRRAEAAVLRRLLPIARVVVRASAGGLEEEPWGVEPDVVRDAEERVAAVSQSQLAAILRAEEGALVGRSASALAEAPGSGSEIVVWVEDLRLTYPRGESLQGYEKAYFVRAVDLVENPERFRTRSDLERVRDELALTRAARFRPEDAFSQELERLARWDLERLETKMAALAVEVPQLLWGEEAYPVSYVAEEAQLSLSYRLGDGTTRKVIVARVSFHDRLVAGEPGRNVLRDPREVPARESLILLLASRLASNLADEVAGELRRRREALYERALERLEARSFDGATEDLVGFLYARRGTADRRFERAVRLLLELTGCNLPAMW